MKPITKSQFRVLLTLYIVALVASTVAGFLDSRLLPQPLLDYQQSQHGVPPKTAEIVVGLLGFPGVIAWLVSIVGLYRFWPCARWLNVAAWIYVLVLTIFSPGEVMSNEVASALSHCSTLLAGAVIAIVYFSPAADWFQKQELIHVV